MFQIIWERKYKSIIDLHGPNIDPSLKLIYVWRNNFGHWRNNFGRNVATSLVQPIAMQITNFPSKI